MRQRPRPTTLPRATHRATDRPSAVVAPRNTSPFQPSFRVRAQAAARCRLLRSHEPPPALATLLEQLRQLEVEPHRRGATCSRQARATAASRPSRQALPPGALHALLVSPPASSTRGGQPPAALDPRYHSWPDPGLARSKHCACDAGLPTQECKPVLPAGLHRERIPVAGRGPEARADNEPGQADAEGFWAAHIGRPIPLRRARKLPPQGGGEGSGAEATDDDATIWNVC